LASQIGICLFAASGLNFRPQHGHCVIPLACYDIAFYYPVNAYPLPCFSPARNAALCNFHFGIFYSATIVVVFFIFYGLLGGGGCCGCLNPYSYNFLWAAASNAFLLVKNTFSHIL
jgi:hypothetical protein